MNFKNIFKTNKTMNNMISEMENMKPENKPAKIEAPKIEQPEPLDSKIKRYPNKVSMTNEEFGKLLNIAPELGIKAVPEGDEPRDPELDERDYTLCQINDSYNNFGQPISTYKPTAYYHNKREELEFNDELKYGLALLWMTNEILG